MAFNNIKQELKKVIWPTGKQTAQKTLAVIALVLLVSLIVIVFDFILVKGNDFAIDQATGGKVTEYKTEMQQKSDILNEMKAYTTDAEWQQYNSIAYYMTVEGLQSALDELKSKAASGIPATGTEEGINPATSAE